MAAPLTCTNHCSQCGRHFHSLRGFDLHLERDEAGWPQCSDPLDLEDKHGEPRLVLAADDGECRIYAGVKRGVTIWTQPQNDQAAAWLVAQRGP